MLESGLLQEREDRYSDGFHARWPFHPLRYPHAPRPAGAAMAQLGHHPGDGPMSCSRRCHPGRVACSTSWGCSRGRAATPAGCATSCHTRSSTRPGTPITHSQTDAARISPADCAGLERSPDGGRRRAGGAVYGGGRTAGRAILARAGQQRALSACRRQPSRRARGAQNPASCPWARQQNWPQLTLGLTPDRQQRPIGSGVGHVQPGP